MPVGVLGEVRRQALKKISDSLQENVHELKNILHADKNFDLIYREQKLGDKDAGFFFIDGFIKDTIMERLLKSFSDLKDTDIPANAGEFSDKYIPYVEVDLLDDVEDIVTAVLSGVACYFVDGYSECMAIDCRTYPMRSVDEPWKDRVLRGSRDGFVETIVSNVALIRRRIRDPRLCVEILHAGIKSRTDISVAYLEGVADMKLLRKIKDKIEQLDVEALTMNIESLAEAVLDGPYINPFPKFKYTERPDTAAASILDGNIVLIVDNSPAVIVVPASIFDVMEEADDFYFPPIVGNYIRFSRFIMSVLTLILTPMWMALIEYPEKLPDWLAFINLTDEANIHVFWQLIILEFAIDGLRLAAVNTPTMLSTPLSVVAGIVVGEYAVSSGWFSPETMLYMAFVAIGTYAQANFELGYAIKFFRLITLVLTYLFYWWGFFAGVIITMLAIAFNNTISGESYIYPIVPFDGKKLIRKLFRVRLPRNNA